MPGRSGGRGVPPGERLRHRLGQRLDVPPDRILLTASGTEALILALEVARGEGAEALVAIPAYTCWDVGTAVQATEGEARFFDLDPTTLAPDLSSVEEALSAGAAVLVVSPLFGYPVPWSELKEMAHRYGAVLVEDSAQAHGSRWTDGAPGTLGDLSVLSFGRGKGWTGGGGGCMIVHEDRLASHLRRPRPPSTVAALVRSPTLAAAQAVFGRPSLYGLPASVPWLRLGDSVYHPPTPPRGMPAFQAALALATEAKAEEEAARRRARATLLLQRIHTTSEAAPIRPGRGGQPGFLRLPVLARAPSRSWTATARRLGVVPAYPRALSEVPQLGSIRPSRLPTLSGAALLAERLLTVPTHSLLAPEDLDRIVTLLERG